MTALAIAFAALWFLLWLIEHFGGREQRDDLRLQLLIAEHERDVARSMVHPSRRHLAAVPDAYLTPCAPCGSHADCWRDA